MAPTNLQAVVNPDHTVTLTWQDNTGGVESHRAVLAKTTSAGAESGPLPAGVTTWTSPVMPNAKYDAYVAAGDIGAADTSDVLIVHVTGHPA